MSAPRTSSPERARLGSEPNGVTRLVLETCRTADPSAHVSSVLRDDAGRTIVRVRTNPNRSTDVLLQQLRAAWPLANCSVHENALDGVVEASIVVPKPQDEKKRALKMAKRSSCSEFLLACAFVLALLSIASYLQDVRGGVTNGEL